MLQAVIYESNTGYTQKYAKLLGDELKIPVYAVHEGAKVLHEGDEIIFLGWIKAGFINGYEVAKKWYKVKAVCGVGVGGPDAATEAKMCQQNKVPDETRLFLLQGGFSLDKLHGMNKLMMKMMRKVLISEVEAKSEKSVYDENIIQMMTQGGDFVTKENLDPILIYLKNTEA